MSQTQAGAQQQDRMAVQRVTVSDLERLVGLEFIRATEAAALSAYKWMGKGDKESGDFAACDAIRNDVHQVQPAAISITNATEYGVVYRAAEIAAVGELAKERRLALHMDCARLANVVVSTGQSLADLTWRAGVDALSFGFVKNGGLHAEALVLFRTELADEIAVRRKRAGHLLSKGRYLAAQLLAMLDGDLWLENARAANAAARTLATAAPQRLVYPVEANELFLKVTPKEAARLRGMGFDFYDWGPGEIRLVTSWDQQGDALDRLAAAIAAL